MPREWQDKRKYPVAGPAKCVWSIRARVDLKKQVNDLAKKNNTTVEAIVDFALEHFLDENDPKRQKPAPAAPAGADLFD